MRYTRLGPLRVSVIGIGLWQAGSRYWGTKKSFKINDLISLLNQAIENGINLFDTAEIYGWGRSEKLLGDALKQLDWEELVVASKIGGFRTTRYTILKAAEGIKRRLGRAPEILQHHWPPPIHSKLCWIANGLEKSIDKGLAHYIGLSNYSASMLDSILNCFRKHEPISIQVQYSLAYRSPENLLIPKIRKLGMGLLAWSPLAKGALAGLREPLTSAQRTDPVFRKASRDKELQNALQSLAERKGVNPSQIALAWIISKNGIPIPGTRKPSRVNEYARASSIDLTPDEINTLDNVSSKYLTLWGKDYRSLQWLRLIPSPFQYLAIRLTGGI